MSVGAEDEDTYLVEQSDEFRSLIAELERPELIRQRATLNSTSMHVAVAHLVGLPLRAQQPALARLGHAPAGHQVVVRRRPRRG